MDCISIVDLKVDMSEKVLRVKCLDARLHLHVLQGVIKNTRGVDTLESEILVVEMSNEQGLGGECIGLNIDVGARDGWHKVSMRQGLVAGLLKLTAKEGTLADVGEAGNKKSPGVGVDRGQTAQMLSNLLEVEEGVFETLLSVSTVEEDPCACRVPRCDVVP